MNLFSFIRNKSISLALTALAIFGMWIVSAHNQEWWRLLLISIIVFGQGHFLVSYYYAYTSRKKPLTTSREWVWWIGLAIASLSGLVVMFIWLPPGYASAVLAIQFLAHALLNERTMIERYIGIHIGYIATWAAIAWCSALYALSFVGESFGFFFHQQRLYWETKDRIAQLPSTEIANDAVMLFFVVLAAGLSFWALYESRKDARVQKVQLLIFSLFAFVLVGCLVTGFIPLYTVIMAGIIIYHYITWFMFSIDAHPTIENITKAVVSNIVVYIFLIGFFVLGNVYMQHTWAQIVYASVFSMHAFVYWTTLHIHFTLINETPVRDVFTKLLGKLGPQNS